MVNLSCSFGSEIVIGQQLDLAAAIKLSLPQNCSRIAVITDANVMKLYDKALGEILEQTGIDYAFFPSPAGEQYKTRKTKERIEDLLLTQGFGRDSAILGFGGGTVTDLAGFIAATYARGIPFLAIPTTLMAMVDASIGGKVAVNTPHAKNSIGTFYPAKTVLIDPCYLATLPEAEILNGLAEVYKYGLIASPHLLTMLATDKHPSLDLIEICCAVKKEIVEADFVERGFRRILNFGHTVGHALEIASGYSLAHGLAVAAGMRAESWLSFALGHLSSSDFETIEQLLARFPPPPKLPHKKIIEALAQDKKNSAAKARFVLLEKIGAPLPFEGEYCDPVDVELVEEAIKRLYAC